MQLCLQDFLPSLSFLSSLHLLPPLWAAEPDASRLTVVHIEMQKSNILAAPQLLTSSQSRQERR